MPAITKLDQFSGYIPMSGVTLAQYPHLQGSVLYDHILEIVDPGEAVYKVQVRVVRSTQTGLLDFYYRIFLPPVHNGFLQVFLDGMVTPAHKVTFADFRLDGLGTIPAKNLFMDVQQALVFTFDPISPAAGQETRFIFVSSDAKNFSPGAGRIHLSVGKQGTPVPGPA